MQRNRRRLRTNRPSSPSLLERINPNAAGIDCGSAEHYVAVPADRDPNPIRAFKTFTSDLHRLANWLCACGVTTVAMEATGVYWILIYEILEARGIEVVLVNARHVKNVPGRKSDVMDCEWLRELTAWAYYEVVSVPPLPSPLCAAMSAIGRPSCRPPRPPCSACKRPSSR